MNSKSNQDEHIAKMTFALVHSLYLTKILTKDRTKDELHQIIEWLQVIMIKSCINSLTNSRLLNQSSALPICIPKQVSTVVSSVKKQIQNLFTFIGIFILISCSTNINFNEYIDQNLPLELIIKKSFLSNDSTIPIRIEIPANSEKFNKLTKWAKNNTTDWETTQASYIAEVFVGQGDFRLLYTTGTYVVIIGFTDSENKPKQYSKKIKKGELDFLVQ